MMSSDNLNVMALSIGTQECKQQINDFLQAIGFQHCLKIDAGEFDEKLICDATKFQNAVDKLITYLKEIKSNFSKMPAQEIKSSSDHDTGDISTDQDIDVETFHESSTEAMNQNNHDVEMKENPESEQIQAKDLETKEEDYDTVPSNPKSEEKSKNEEDVSERQEDNTLQEEKKAKNGETNEQGGLILQRKCGEDRTEDERKLEEMQKRQNNEVNLNLVQIKASNLEIERRISAFIEQKQVEKDEYNKREFYKLNMTEHDSNDSCARVGSMFVTRVGGKSHIKVTRVVNIHGPQTQVPGNTAVVANIKTEPESEAELTEGIDERIQNIESHLKVKCYSKEMKNDVFARLKKLEERILYLESISPEYFSNGIPAPSQAKRQKVQKFAKQEYAQEQEMSLSDIERKIQQLRKSLKQQAGAF